MMDEKSGASLKLTVLNPKGRVWTMVAGGGGSVIYTDMVNTVVIHQLILLMKMLKLYLI